VDIDTVHARLQGESLGALVTLVVDHLMNQPLSVLVDPGRVADQVLRALDTATRGDQTEDWLRARVADLRGRVPQGRLGDHIPEEVRAPLESVLARPYQLDRELVGRLMDHAAVRDLVKDVMRSSLDGFVQKVKDLQHHVPVPASGPSHGGLGRLRALSQGVRAVSEGVVSQVSKEFEQRLSGKVSEFVDEALALAMAQVADHLCDAAHAERWGQYRAYLLQTGLDLENRKLIEELDKLDPDHLVAVGTATARSLARREGFRDEIAGLVAGVVDATEGRTLRDFLAETGLEGAEAEWRAEIEGQLAEQARAVVATPAFRGWLEALLAP
jgi:hypothetical protein